MKRDMRSVIVLLSAVLLSAFTPRLAAQETFTANYVVLTSNNAEWGQVRGAGTYPASYAVLITAVSNNESLYEFKQWKVHKYGTMRDGTVVDTTYYKDDAAYGFRTERREYYTYECEAEFVVREYKVHVSAEPAEAALWFSLDNLQSEHKTDSSYLATETPVIDVYAEPAAGYVFDHVEIFYANNPDESIGLAYVNPYPFRGGNARLLENVNFVIHFTEKNRLLGVIVDPQEGGTSPLSSIEAMRVGRELELELDLTPGWKLTAWKERDQSGWLNPVVLNEEGRWVMPDRDVSLVAQVEKIEYAIRVEKAFPEGDYPGWMNDHVEIYGAGTYSYGDEVALSVNDPDGEFVLDYWFIDDGNHEGEGPGEAPTPVSYENPWVFAVADSGDYRAMLKRRPRHVQVQSIPEGVGVFVGAGDYDAGTIARITARNGAGYTFSRWTDFTGTANYGDRATLEHRVSQDTVLFARYTPNQYTIEVLSEGMLDNGKVRIDDGEFKVSYEEDFDYDRVLHLKAEPKDGTGYLFWHWRIMATNANGVILYDSILSHLDTIDYVVKGSVTITACFVENGRKVRGGVLLESAYAANPHIDLSLLPLEDTIGILRNTGNYRQNNWISLRAQAKAGFVFSRWMNQNGEFYSETRPELLLQVTQDTFAYALFKPDTVSLTLALADGFGSAVLSGAQRYEYGDEAIAKVEPEHGYVFKAWYSVDADGNRDSVSDEPEYRFVIERNVALQAELALAEYRVSVRKSITDRDNIAAQGANYGDIIGEGYYTYQSEAILEVEPSSGYTFKSWILGMNPGDTINAREVLHIDVTDNIEIEALFDIGNVKWEVRSDNPLMGEIDMPSATGSDPLGTVKTFKAKSYDGYRLAGWRDEAGNLLFAGGIAEADLELMLRFDTVVYAVFEGNRIEMSWRSGGNGVVRAEPDDRRVPIGEYRTLIATPNLGYEFDSWTDTLGNVISRSSILYFQPMGDTVLQGNFVPSSYEVTLGVEPFGSGAVELAVKNNTDTTRIDGVGGVFRLNDTLLLNAYTSSHYNFLGWTQSVETDEDFDSHAEEPSAQSEMAYVSTEEQMVWIADGQYNHLTAVFEPKVYTLSIECDPVAGAVEFVNDTNKCQYGSYITVLATPNDKYRFNGWYKGDVWLSNAARYDYYPQGDELLTAHFSEDSLTVNLVLEWGGEVSGAGKFLQGTSITVSATANDGFVFVGWYDFENLETPLSTDADYTFTVTENKTLYARFGGLDLTIYAKAGTGGTVAVVGSGQNDGITLVTGNSADGKKAYAAYGSTVTFLATPDSGYSFDKWVVSGAELVEGQAESNYLSVDVYRDIHAEAVFIPNFYDVRVSASPYQWGMVSGGGLCTYGTKVRLQALPVNSNYEFIGWTCNGILIETNSVIEVDVEGDDCYVALFQPIRVEAGVSAMPEDGALTYGSGSYFYGDSIRFGISPYKGMALQEWTSSVNPEWKEQNTFFYHKLLEDEQFEALLVYKGTEDDVLPPYFVPRSETILQPGGSVRIECATEGVDIYYVFGNARRTPNIRYTGPITLTDGAYITAWAMIPGQDTSEKVTGVFYVEGGADPDPDVKMVEPPTFTPNGGDVYADDLIYIGCVTPGAEIYYTKDRNSEPDTRYELPLEVDADTMYIRAWAVIPGEDTSEIVERMFYVEGGLDESNRYYVYPNPIEPDGVMNIRVLSSELTYIRLYTPAGALVYSREIHQKGAHYVSIHLPKYLSGVFVYELGLNGKTFVRDKVVIPVRL